MTSGENGPQDAPHELQHFMQQAAHEMAQEYSRIRQNAADDPGTAGDEGEENWKELLENWLPPTLPVVTKGKIVGIDGRLSPQVDVLVLSPSYPTKLLNKKKYLAGGVLAAFECKLTLKKEHLEKSAETCREIQEIAEAVNRPCTMFTELNSPITYGILAHSSAWSRQTAVRQIDTLLNNELAKDTRPRRSMDLVCVADLATWIGFRIAIPRFPSIDDGLWNAMRAQNGLWEDGGIQVQYSRWTPWEGNEEVPNPFYVAIAKILRRLAWTMPELRPLSEYWNLAGGPSLSGGAGAVRSWPFSSLESEAKERARIGALKTGASWDEWGIAYW